MRVQAVLLKGLRLSFKKVDNKVARNAIIKRQNQLS
jgi:hypothetical protein